MTRKIICLTLVIFISAFVFAETSAESHKPKSFQFNSKEEMEVGVKIDFSEFQNVSDEDCKNLVQNYEVLKKTLEIIDNCDVENLLETTDFLNRNGISGSNAVMKVQAIQTGVWYFQAKDELPAQGKAILGVMKVFGFDMFKTIKELVHEEDFKVIKRNRKLLLKVM